MKKELLEKKAELLKEIQAIDQSLEIEEMKEDIEKLMEFTDILNSMLQDSVVEKYSSEASGLLYEAMQILDKISKAMQILDKISEGMQFRSYLVNPNNDVTDMEIEKENNFSS